MHLLLIVSRKEQANNKKLSPLTNHKNTKNGVITGGFDRVNLFQQAEQGFDRMFCYNRQQTESFEYHNIIQNSSMSEQLKLKEQEFHPNDTLITTKQVSRNTINLFFNTENSQRSSSLITIVSSKTSNPPESKETILDFKKKIKNKGRKP